MGGWRGWAILCSQCLPRRPAATRRTICVSDAGTSLEDAHHNEGAAHQEPVDLWNVYLQGEATRAGGYVSDKGGATSK